MVAEPRKQVIDPKAQATLLQHRAADPAKPVWVEASAGSGKTKVLVDRMLRLMLPAPGHVACSPATILCITFTKAAAAEVLDRVMKRLRNWATTDDLQLHKSLDDLLGAAPDAAQIKQARSLFAEVLDSPGGMKIMTIHAFCQSVLARFPLEAGLPSGFALMDDVQARDLMRDVRRNLIAQLMAEDHISPLKAAFAHLSALQTIEDIERLMEKLSSERARLADLIQLWGGIDPLCSAIDAYLGIEQDLSDDSLISDFLAGIPADDLQNIAGCLAGGTDNQKKIAAALTSAAASAPVLNAYLLIFLLSKFESPRKAAKAVQDNPAASAAWDRETARCLELVAMRRTLQTSLCTKSLMRFGSAALNSYALEKRRRNLSDFEDLITLTKKLLSGDGVHWVQYKLDQGIDHILVDEAQDTNPDQWDIIASLYDEFYSGLSTREEKVRTTFVVGDEKQSIYSFQRADPRIFVQQYEQLDVRTGLTQNPQQTIALNASFRSGASVLAFVDKVFAQNDTMEGVVRPGTAAMRHEAADSGKAARVELWPVIKTENKRSKNSKPEDWDAAWVVQGGAVQALAERIADTIKGWMDRKEILASAGRPIEPGDILILLAKRKPLAEPILRALRARHIPVTGIDRMILSEQIAIQDSLAALSFALAPDDDLTLASLLKSPFVGMDEETLFGVAHDRAGSLWDSLRNHHAHNAVSNWLSELLAVAGSATPSAFLHHVFYTPCPANDISGMRALLSRLGSDAIDPLQELLARADHHAMTGTGALQDFLHAALNDTSQIKRDMDASDNRVRLMTVHGAKGLEAPIVFLPDTLRGNQSLSDMDTLQWPERNLPRRPDNVPLWSISSREAAAPLTVRLQSALVRADEEYHRLLYVALTRAAERLYIAAAQTDTDGRVDPGSWYFACRRAFDNLPLKQNDDKILFIENAQTSRPDDKRRMMAHIADAAPLPDWALAAAPVPEFPPRPLMPSRPEGIEPSSLSPLAGDQTQRFKRGRIIHTLFQFLPDLPAEQRRGRASAWLARPAHQLSGAQQSEILESIFAVLDHPDFAGLFGPDARAEVPVTGMLGMAVVSGQIDRLMMTDDTITILDYKTNRPAPEDPAGVPAAYRAQLRLYQGLLKKIWPDKGIRTVLLWTDGPKLMDMTLDL